jgi:hypothetical protein
MSLQYILRPFNYQETNIVELHERHIVPEMKREKESKRTMLESFLPF